MYYSGRFAFSWGVEIMALTVEAVYENGVLKPAGPLPLKEHEKVRITVEQGDSPLVRAYGIIGWTGDAETLERIALDPEFLPEESP
jgi:predicted DNA-binding antitoxin AbrB/MazE fold protein